MYKLGQKQSRSVPIVKILFLTFLLSLVTLGVIKLFNLEKPFVQGPKTIVQLITDSGLKNDRGRINVLLLGIGGQGHKGPDLSDTLILASIDKDSKDVALVSIPRDLWAPSLGAKINAAYAFGQEKDKGGLALAQKIVSDLFDLPISYAIRVDFNGFIKAVDLVGGLDIDVENPFTDTKYPIAGKEDDTCGYQIETQEIDGVVTVIAKDATGSAIIVTDENNPFICRYETISFDMGPTHMDGTTALKFVRSRMGTSGEGSDFARSARQQKVILAFRQKVLSTQTLTSPSTVIDLINTFGQSIDTNITDEEIPHFIKLGTKIDPATVRRVVLDADRPESVLLVSDPQTHRGQFALIPKGDSWTDLAEYVQGEIFKLEEK